MRGKFRQDKRCKGFRHVTWSGGRHTESSLIGVLHRVVPLTQVFSVLGEHKRVELARDGGGMRNESITYLLTYILHGAESFLSS